MCFVNSWKPFLICLVLIQRLPRFGSFYVVYFVLCFLNNFCAAERNLISLTNQKLKIWLHLAVLFCAETTSVCHFALEKA